MTMKEDMVWLVISGVSPTLWSHPINAKKLVLGRSSECDVQVIHSSVSRRHAEIRQEDEMLYIRDLKSKNGTMLNSSRVTCDTLLMPGSLLMLGSVSLEVL